jgi:hypothetical protein
MTRLEKRKSRLIVETSDTVRERGKLRAVILEPSPYLVAVRLKGLRQRYEVSYAGIYAFAARIAADKARQERAERRKAKRSGAK